MAAFLMENSQTVGKVDKNGQKQVGKVDDWIANGKVVPLEIKSGKDYKRHSALNNVLECEEYQISEGYIFSEGNVETVGRKVYMPIYMIMFLEEKKMENTIYKLDLSGLANRI